MATQLQREINYHLAHFGAPDLVSVMKYAILRHGFRHRGYYIAPLSELDRMLSEACQNVLAHLTHYRRQQRIEQQRLRQRRNLMKM
jgi:dihydrodipicolinate synthase/N-acetylneuraminate lyase